MRRSVPIIVAAALALTVWVPTDAAQKKKAPAKRTAARATAKR